jgi:hypothetical protein
VPDLEFFQIFCHQKKSFFAGHCSNSVDLPALDYLATKYCNYTIESHFIIFDTRATFSEQYKGLGTFKLQSLLGYEAGGGNKNAMGLRDRKSAHFSAAFGAEATAFLYFIPTGFQHAFPLVCFILLSLNSFPTLPSMKNADAKFNRTTT